MPLAWIEHAIDPRLGAAIQDGDHAGDCILDSLAWGALGGGPEFVRECFVSGGGLLLEQVDTLTSLIDLVRKDWATRMTETQLHQQPDQAIVMHQRFAGGRL